MNQAVQAAAPAQKRKPKETGVPDNKKYLHPLLAKNYGNWRYFLLSEIGRAHV